MNKHTPGPWRYERIEKPGYCSHSYVWGPRVSIHCAGGNINGVEPDMLLIASAPELLAELEMLSNIVEGCGLAAMPEVECRIAFARAALAKANGEFA